MRLVSIANPAPPLLEILIGSRTFAIAEIPVPIVGYGLPAL